MPDLSSIAREAAKTEAEARILGDSPHAIGYEAGPAFADGAEWCASRLPSEDELAEAMAARLWDRDTGDVEPWEKLSPGERENVIENYDARDYAKLALSLIGVKIAYTAR